MRELISSEGHLQMEGKPRSTTKRHQTHHQANIDYFKKWSSNMAYILGFTASDGCVYVNNKDSEGIYTATWSVCDKDVLEFIKKELEATQMIRHRPKWYYRNSNIKNPKDQWYLTICSKEMVADLALLGICPRKSNIIQLPEDYPKEYMKDYIRGVMDGDGCWAVDISHKRPHPRAFIYSGSKIYLQQLGDFLKNELHIIPKIYLNDSCYKLSYGGPEVAALADYVRGGFMIERKSQRMKKAVEGYTYKICKNCKRPFVKVAGLNNICIKCKKRSKI